MLNSLFIMSTSGVMIIEKHWKGKIPRSVADDFYGEHVLTAESPKEVLPIISGLKYVFVHVLSNELIFLGVLTKEAPAMMILEILGNIASTFERYFEVLSEDTLRDNFVTAYELLEETIDDGFPMSFEPTLLKDLVPPPTLGKLIKNLTPDTSGPPTTALDTSPVPWRKLGIRYANNEIFFDIVEELHTVLDNEGRVITSEALGSIEVNCCLTGMPDVLVQFHNPEVVDDASFHQCVRLARFEQDRALFFVPPDGNFTLMKYRVVPSGSAFQAPFYVQPQIGFGDGTGRVTIMVGLRGGGFGEHKGKDKDISDVRLTIPLPQAVDSCSLDVTQGSSMFDYTTREIIWDIGRLQQKKTSPSLTAALHLRAGSPKPASIPPVLVDYKQTGVSFSGLKIDSVTLLNEKYRPYKGHRSLCKAGKFVIRS